MSGSAVEWVTLPRSCLGTLRRFPVYLPAGLDANRGHPVLWLLRGHETEWLGSQDGRRGLVPILDRMIARGMIPPILAVMPGFMDPERKFQGVPVNWSEDGAPHGVGNGRFEDHYFEIRSAVEAAFPVARDREAHAIDGFSMGGYSALLLAARHPHAFGSVSAFDGSFMWPGQIDPRRGPTGRACRLWFSRSCAPFFGRNGAWDRDKMERHNPATILVRSRADRIRLFKNLRFHLRCAADERIGNVDRTRWFSRLLEEHGLKQSFPGRRLVLHPDARHDWNWAERHLEEVLPLHFPR